MNIKSHFTKTGKLTFMLVCQNRHTSFLCAAK